jgi:uncharacterized protein YjbJ (UPF0337 family)
MLDTVARRNARSESHIERKNEMDTNIFEGKWKQFRGKIKEEWGWLTDDELDQAKGKRDQMVGLLQEKYGYAKDRAEKEFDQFVHGLDN